MHSKRSAQAEHSSRRLQDAFMESLEAPPSNTENALARAPRRKGRAVEKNHNQPESDASANKDNNANDTGWLIGYDDAVDDVVAGYIARTEVDGVNDDIEYGALNERDATKDVDAYTAVDYLGSRRNLNFMGDRQMTQSDAFATPNIIYEVQNGDGREYFITFVESDSFVKYDDLADNLKNLAIQVSNLSNNDTPPERKCCKVWRENDQRTHDETRADNGDNNHHHPDSGEAVDNADSHAAFRKVDPVDENEVIELKFEGKGEDTPEKSHPREGCNLKVATYHCAHPCENEDGQNATVLFSGRLAAPDLVCSKYLIETDQEEIQNSWKEGNHHISSQSAQLDSTLWLSLKTMFSMAALGTILCGFNEHLFYTRYMAGKKHNKLDRGRSLLHFLLEPDLNSGLRG